MYHIIFITFFPPFKNPDFCSDDKIKHIFLKASLPLHTIRKKKEDEEIKRTNIFCKHAHLRAMYI